MTPPNPPNPYNSLAERWTSVRDERRSRQAARAARKTLERDLAGYTTQRELDEIHTLMRNCGIDDLDEIRRLVPPLPVG